MDRWQRMDTSEQKKKEGFRYWAIALTVVFAVDALLFCATLLVGWLVMGRSLF
jgi:hypothetical protein